MRLMENNLFNVSFDSSNEILHCVWTKDTENANWDDMKEALLSYRAQAEKHCPAGILVDERLLEDLFIEVSVKQMMEEDNTAKLITNFFDNYASAEKWLIDAIAKIN